MSTPTISSTYIGSAVSTGSNSLSQTIDGGWVVLSQSTVVTSIAAGTAVVGSVQLPVNSQIIEIFADKVVDWAVGGGTADALNVLAGNASGGAQYMPSTDMASVARTEGTLTVANVLARSSIGNNVTVYFTVDPNGTVLTTQAQIRFTVVYSQTQ